MTEAEAPKPAKKAAKAAKTGEPTKPAKQPRPSKGVFSGNGKWYLTALFSFLMLIPAGVLAVRGLTQRQVCSSARDACYASCADAYKSIVIVFQSQLEGQKLCNGVCDAQDATCAARATAVMGAGALLVAGLVTSAVLVCCLDAIMQRLGMTNAEVEIPRPRAAYEEPIFTEYEKWKMRGGKKKGNGKFATVEATCLRCHLPVDVNQEWLTGLGGGRDGAVCPRCRYVCVGVV